MRMRKNLADQERNRITIEQLGDLHRLTGEAHHLALHRDDHPEEKPRGPNPTDEVVKKMLEVKKGKKVVGLEEAAKKKEVRQSRANQQLHLLEPWQTAPSTSIGGPRARVPGAHLTSRSAWPC